MKVWVISLELDYEGSSVYEVWKGKSKAKKRVEYLNKNNAGCCEKFEMYQFNIRGLIKKDANQKHGE